MKNEKRALSRILWSLGQYNICERLEKNLPYAAASAVCSMGQGNMWFLQGAAAAEMQQHCHDEKAHAVGAVDDVHRVHAEDVKRIAPEHAEHAVSNQ